MQPGDCIVAFSRKDIFEIKAEIERTTDHKVGTLQCFHACPLKARIDAVAGCTLERMPCTYDVMAASCCISNCVAHPPHTGFAPLDHAQHGGLVQQTLLAQ